MLAAADGKEGVERFAGSAVDSIDAILMDIRMPVMDGIAAAQEIRKLDRSDATTVPIIAVSADAYAEDIQRSKAAGMNDHIAKPIDAQQLFQALLQQMR